MSEVSDFVDVLKGQFPISNKGREHLEEKIIKFWLNVGRLAEGTIGKPDSTLDNDEFILSELWSNFDGLPNFKNDTEACIYFANIVRDGMNKRGTNLELFKLERRIARLESNYIKRGRDWGV